MLRRLAPPRTLHRALDLPGRELLEQERFLELISKERERADRTHDELSLATIRLGSPRRGSDPGLHHALEMILRRVRRLDEVGWLRPGTLGLLLPATSPAGARKLVGDLRRNDTTGHLRHGRWEFYSYPEDWVEGADEDGQGGGHGSSGNGRVHGTGLLPIGHDPSPPALNRFSDSDPAASDRAARKVRPLADLLVAPLPWWKRAIDILGSVLGLGLLSPLMLAAAAAVKLTSQGPVFYTSWRSGVRGRPFRFYKFRTMCVDADARREELLELNEASGPVFKITGDPRVTWIGRFLRKTSIDELPQLWNVLKGDMSLVGPRPPIPKETTFYTPWQRRRLEGKGGLTCIWQVSGRSNVDFEDWVRMDIHYLERRSFGKDLLILLETIPAVFSCRGAK